MKKVLNYVYPYRFQVFFISLLMVLFGSLLMPRDIYEDYFISVFLVINLIAGTALFLYARKFVLNMTLVLVLLVLLSFVNRFTVLRIDDQLRYRFFLYAFYYTFVAFELVKQVWRAKTVSSDIIMGMMSGYISLGLVAYFGFMGIEALVPGSYNGIPADMLMGEKSRQLMNFSYITLLTVGYGDISPASFVAQKLAVLTAMMGQFYLVIITAVVIGKFLQGEGDK